MTSDERYGIPGGDDPSGVGEETGSDGDGKPDEADAWDLEAEPTGRAFAPAADGPAPGVRYAELPIRAAAFALDAVLLITISEGVFRALSTFIFSGILSPSSTPGPGSRSLYLAVILALVGLVAAQAVVMTYLTRVFRATPGQMVLGLFTLSRRHGRALGPSAAFVRWLTLFAPLAILTIGPLVVSVVSQFIASSGQTPPDPLDVASTITQLAPVAWFVVLIASMLLDESGRGLHDHLSGSVVVRRDGPPN